MKKRLMRFLAGIVCAITAVHEPLQAYAAGTATKYISDIQIYVGSSYAEGEKVLHGKGYEIVPTDVNSTLGPNVYIGYKTTKNASEAITDIAFMNMKGDYSFSEYEKLLEENRETVNRNIENLIPAIEEYRANYQKKTQNALYAYTLMNKVIVDDTEQGMGDFLLECELKDGKRDLLRDVVMKGNSQLMIAVEQALAMASDDANDTWLDRFSKLTYDDIEDRYTSIYLTASKAEKVMNADYENDARTLLDAWDALYDLLQTVENTYLQEEADGDAVYDISEVLEYTASETGEELTAEEKEVSDVVASVDTTNDIMIYETLMELEYDGDAMLDFFNRPSADVELYELYPLVEAMSEAQVSQMAMTGFKQNILSAICKSEEWNAESKTAFDGYISQLETVSVYDGVDQRLFDGSVALTGDAVEHSNSSTDKWYDALWSTSYNESRGTAVGILWGATALMGVLTVAFVSLCSAIAGSAVRKVGSSGIRLIYNNGLDASFNVVERFFMFHSTSPVVNLFAIVAKVCFIVTILLAVFSLYFSIQAIVIANTGKPYERVPQFLLDTHSNRNTSEYVYYQAAETTDGGSADVNGHDSTQGWLMLYYTKDPEAGAPITANLQVQCGTAKLPLNCNGAAHMFGSLSAANLTAKAYTGEDDHVNGTYLFFKRSSLSYAGSTFSGGVAALAGGIGVGAGAMLGAALGMMLRKKKKKPAAV